MRTFPNATYIAAELSLLEWEMFAKNKARRPHSLRAAQELTKLHGLCFEGRNDFALQRKEGMEEKRDKTMIKTGLQKSQKYPGMFGYLQYQKLGITFFPFMTKTQKAKNLHFLILHMCLAVYAELFRHVKASLLRI